MSSFIAFIEVVGAIVTAMGLAMWLEWLTLNGLLHVMPGYHHRQHEPGRTSTANPGPTASRVKKPSSVPVLTLFPR